MDGLQPLFQDCVGYLDNILGAGRVRFGFEHIPLTQVGQVHPGVGRKSGRMVVQAAGRYRHDKEPVLSVMPAHCQGDFHFGYHFRVQGFRGYPQNGVGGLVVVKHPAEFVLGRFRCEVVQVAPSGNAAFPLAGDEFFRLGAAAAAVTE